MADLTSTTPLRRQPSPTSSPADVGGETHRSLALKSIFWFILGPIGLLYLVKWLLHLN